MSVCVFSLELMCHFMQNGSGSNDAARRGHASDNPFYSNIDSMPDIRPRRKSIPLVSELVSESFSIDYLLFFCGKIELYLYLNCERII